MTHYVHVPLRLSDQMLRIDINELPPCEQLIQILENEEAPLDVWLQAAVGLAHPLRATKNKAMVLILSLVRILQYRS